MPSRPTPEDLIDASKAIPIPAVQIWWSREYQRYIAVAPAFAGVFGLGNTFSAAAIQLDDALAEWVEESRKEKTE